MKAPLNLSRRPFRNERLPTLLLSAAAVVLVAATFRHAVAAWDLLPGRSRDVLGQVAALEAEAARLSAESAQLRELGATPEEIGEWLAVKGLVDRPLRRPGERAAPRRPARLGVASRRPRRHRAHAQRRGPGAG